MIGSERGHFAMSGRVYWDLPYQFFLLENANHPVIRFCYLHTCIPIHQSNWRINRTPRQGRSYGHLPLEIYETSKVSQHNKANQSKTKYRA